MCLPDGWHIAVFMGWMAGLSVAAAAFAAFAFAGAVAGVAATAAFAAAATRLGLELFGSSVAYNGDLAFEAHVLACQRMVEVHHNVGVGNVDNHAVDAESVLGHHREHGAFLDDFGVEFAVDFKNVAGQGGHLLGVVGTESLIGRHFHVERITGLEAVDCVLQRHDYAGGNAKHYLFGIVGRGLVNELVAVRSHFVEVVAEFHVFSGLNCFHIVLYFKFYVVTKAITKMGPKSEAGTQASSRWRREVTVS